MDDENLSGLHYYAELYAREHKFSLFALGLRYYFNDSDLWFNKLALMCRFFF